MNNRNLLTAILAVVLIAYSSTFIVDEREVVIKFRLGEIVSSYDDPGLYFMIPFLIMSKSTILVYSLWTPSLNSSLLAKRRM